MIIASRLLILRSDPQDVEIAVLIHAPEMDSVDWICRLEIEWPEGRAERWAAGVDAVQALALALEMIGTEIYASPHHETGHLEWLAPGRGYGFPVPNNIRDLLVGDDRKFF
ncbi:MAG: hypothetical protein AB1490_10945 [Pseudomonadota bacterium]